MSSLLPAPTPTDPSFLPHPPTRRTLGFYLALVGVVAVWIITPLSWAFLLQCALTSLPRSRLLRALLGWAMLEAIFSIYHLHLAQSIQPLRPQTPNDIAALRQVFLRVLQTGLAPALSDDGSMHINPELVAQAQEELALLPASPTESVQRLKRDDPRAIDFRQRMRTWFRKVSWDQITRESMLTWLSWSCFDLPLSECLASTTQRTVLYEALEMIERRTGTAFPEHSGGPRIVPLRLTMDPIAVWGRPLVMYALVGLSSWCVRMWYESAHGFERRRYGEMDFLVRLPRGWTPERGRRDPKHAPVVLFHGLGVGLMQYNNLLWHLAEELSGHPLLIPLQPHISQDIWHRRHLTPPGRKETVDALSTVIEQLGFGPDEKGEGGVVFLSHSNGTIAHAWMMKDHPALLRRSCFVDPVTFCLWEGDVCYNFVYRTPSTALELLMWYFVGAELGVANTLQRHFVWSDNILWFEEIAHARDEQRFMVVLGGRDAIVDAERVRRYLVEHGVRKGVLFDPEGRHGSALLRDGGGLRTVVEWVKGEWRP